VAIYRPLVYEWIRRYATPHEDAEDVSQEVMAILVREMSAFSHPGRPGAFRGWLRAITANRLRAFWRAGRCRPTIGGDDRFVAMMEQVEDDGSDLSQLWDRQHDEHVLARLIEMIEGEFRENTVRAFRRVVLEQRPVEEVAAALGLSTAAVHIAKSRVLRRLRQEAEGLVEC
jgi:RNA polymerase sigma-70 factor (ECF subfamily)